MKNTVTLKNDKIRVVISPKVGGSIFSVEYRHNNEWIHIMRSTPTISLDKRIAGDFASFNMIPFSNRIKNGRLNYRGNEYALDINNDDGHTIHGEVRSRELEVTQSGSSKITMLFDSRKFEDVSWPFPFRSEIKYELCDENTLSIDMMIENTGTSIMPAGMGIHPYFMRKLTDIDNKVELKMPIRGIYPGETTIPTGHYVDADDRLDFSRGKELTDEFLDSCFAIGEDNIEINWPMSEIKVIIKKDSIFSHGIIYCPKDNKEYFAIEPVTNCNNAFNMASAGIENTGTWEIEPRSCIKGNIQIEIK